MSQNRQNIGKEAYLPTPVGALVDLHRVREHGSEAKAYICLDRNERLQPFPDWFMKAVSQSLESTLLTNYPIQDRLLRQLAEELELPEKQIILTAGADAAIKALYQAYVRPGDRVVILDPSYAMYSVYAQMFQAQAVCIPFDRSLSLDIGLLLESIVSGVRLVMLANPNQPTGTLLQKDVLLNLLEQTANVGAILAIDEAYYPFSHTTVLPWIASHPHLVVIRTFSKAAGLAGLRIGFVVGHADIIANLYKVRSAGDVNSFAILCASLILSNPHIVEDYLAQVESSNYLLTERVQALGLTPLPTHTNFMLIRVAHRCSPAQLVESLRNRGYLVKGPFNTPCLADCIRVTLGSPDLMTVFADVLEQALLDF